MRNSAVGGGRYLGAAGRCDAGRVTPGLFALLIGAGIAAGLAGSIGGLASLFSYPALLAAGLPATAANVTNTVSLAVGSLSTITSSRPDLVGQAGTARKLGLVCALGGATGAGLLLLTPSDLFTRIVPFLVGGASVLLLIGRRRPDQLGQPAPLGAGAAPRRAARPSRPGHDDQATSARTPRRPGRARSGQRPRKG